MLQDILARFRIFEPSLVLSFRQKQFCRREKVLPFLKKPSDVIPMQMREKHVIDRRWRNAQGIQCLWQETVFPAVPGIEKNPLPFFFQQKNTDRSRDSRFDAQGPSLFRARSRKKRQWHSMLASIVLYPIPSSRSGSHYRYPRQQRTHFHCILLLLPCSPLSPCMAFAGRKRPSRQQARDTQRNFPKIIPGCSPAVFLLPVHLVFLIYACLFQQCFRTHSFLLPGRTAFSPASASNRIPACATELIRVAMSEPTPIFVSTKIAKGERHAPSNLLEWPWPSRILSSCQQR